MRRNFWYSIICVLAFIPCVSQAQLQSPLQQAAQARGLVLEMTPSEPGPFETVSVRVVSYLTNVDRAEISWFLDGELIRSGLGEKTFEFQTGGFGALQVVQVSIKEQDGSIFSDTLLVRPSDVTIIWEALTYTPPFYKGKALHTPSSEVMFTALPSFVSADGTLYDTNDLIYTWKQSNAILIEASGRGKSSIRLSNTKFVENMFLDLEVTTPDGQKGSARIEVPNQKAKLLFYENHPLQGMRYAHALTDRFMITGNEAVVYAEPYFFPGKTRTSQTAEYTWLVDRTPVEARESIVLRPSGEGSGQSTVDLSLRFTDYLLQSARNNFTVQYGSGF